MKKGRITIHSVPILKQDASIFDSLQFVFFDDDFTSILRTLFSKIVKVRTRARNVFFHDRIHRDLED